MYLHAGNGRLIRRRSIIGIFDMDTATVSPITRRMLSDMQKKGMVESAADELPKSFVVYRDGEQSKLCLSPLSTAALRGRCETDII